MDWLNYYAHRIDPKAEPPAQLATPNDAVAALAAGNERYAAMRRAGGREGASPQARFLTEGLSPAGTVDRQAPFCIVMGCSDARVPAEIVFDTGPNRLFVVRVAGNVPGDECLGSVEYAMRNFEQSVQIITVLGHVACGAVGAAVTSYLNPKGYADIASSRSLRSVINHVLVAVRSAALSLEQVWGREVHAHAGFGQALAELAVYMNAGITAFQLARELSPEDPPVVFGVYDLASSRVGFPDAAGEFETKLAPAPSTPDQLVELGLALARYPVVRAHLPGVVPADELTGEADG